MEEKVGQELPISTRIRPYRRLKKKSKVEMTSKTISFYFLALF